MRPVAAVMIALAVVGRGEDRAEAQVVRLLSRAVSGPSATANGPSTIGKIIEHFYEPLGTRILSSDGRFVVFTSVAQNLLLGQSSGTTASNVYRYDRQTEATLLISHKDGAPLVSGNGNSTNPWISADGCVVAFDSTSTDLIAGPVIFPIIYQAFVYDCDTNTVELVSHVAGSPTTPGNGSALIEGLSADGNAVVITSNANDLMAGANVQGANLYAYNRLLGQVQLVTRTAASAVTSANEQGGYARLSADGHWVAFSSFSNDLVAGFSAPSGRYRNVFLQELATGTTQLVTRQSGSTSAGSNGNAGLHLSLSADGRFVTYTTGASNLVPGQVDSAYSQDVFLFDRLSGANVLVTRAAGTMAQAGNGESLRPNLSGDGRYVVFESAAMNLLPEFVDGNGYTVADIFLFDRIGGMTSLVSHAAGSATRGSGPGGAARPVISEDGSRVAFWSQASDLVEGQIGWGALNSAAFLFDRPTGLARIASHASIEEPRMGFGAVIGELGLSADGRFVAFASSAPDMVASDANLVDDAFLYGPAASLPFFTVEPCRAVDTRTSDGPAIPAGTTRSFPLRGRCEIPASAESVAINLTAVAPTGPGSLTVFTAGQVVPLSSNTNFSTGQVRANNGVVVPGVAGSVSVFAGMASGKVDVLIDVVGYFE